MKVLVDSSIWSLLLRRRRKGAALDPLAVELIEIIREGRTAIIGPVRQELLSGISDARRFVELRDKLRAFEDIPLETQDYEDAAQLCNACRSKGIQGSQIDFLICASALHRGMPIFTADKDFAHYAEHLPIALYESRTM